MKEEKPLRILFAEDLPSDAELAEKEIRKGGIEFTSRRVETKENFLKALEEFQPDLIISDYRMPTFDGMQALKLSLKRDSTIPVIILTGSMNEETAVECLKAGAVNYVIKEHIARLPFTIKEALEQTKMRSAKDKAEEALRESEERYRTLAESSPGMIFLISKDGRVLYVNGTAASKLHAKPLELVGKHLTELFPPGLANQNLENIQRVIDRKEGSFHETVQKFPTGDIWLESRLSPVIDRSGEVSAVLGLSNDITERRRAEETLKSSEERLRILFEYAPDAYYLSDLTGTFVDGNKAAEELTGYRKEALVGSNFLKLHLLQPNQLVKASSLLAQNFLGRPTGPDEFILTRTDGSVVTVEIRTFPVKVKDKTLVLGIARDITERKRAEEALSESEMKYRTLVTQSPDGIFVVDLSGTFLSVNKTMCDNLKYVEEELLSMKIWDIVPQEYLLLHKNRLAALMKEEKINEPAEYVVIGKDGIVHSIEVRSAPFYKEKEIIGFQGIARDITERKRVEEALTHERNLLRALMDNIPDHIYFKDTDSRFMRISKALAEQFSLGDPALAEGKTDFDFFAEEHARPAFESEKEIMRTGQPLVDLEEKETWPDGRETWVSTTKLPLRDSKGQIIGTFGVSRDITERKRAEETLRYERLLLRTLIDNIPDSIYSKDISCRKTLANLAEVRNMGVKSEAEVLGKDDFEFYPKELAEGFFADDQSVIRTGQPVLNREEYVLDEKGQKRWLLTSKLPLRDKEGHLKGLVGIGRDVTERKQAEEALKKSEEQYRRFFEDDLTGDYVSTLEGKILSCNPAFARIYGFASVEEVLKVNTNTLYTEPEEREIFLRLLKERKKLEYYESEYVRRDGAHVYCVENAVGIFDSEGNLEQIRGYIFDDTKRKTLERQLIQAQKLESLGTLASGIAHDFNNILGIILGYATLLTRQKPDPENIKSSADAVIGASQRGAALVKQLLTFARKVDVQLQSVRLNDIVNEISKLLSETMTKTIEISLHLEEDLPTITGDPTQIHQVLLNLCVNARDAMPKGGTIGITTCCQEGATIRAKFPRAAAQKYVVLSVADTGIGMDKRTQSRIFEPFYTTKEVGKGTGLGLSVVFGILESHNGFVDVESEPGKGTTFHLYFPVLQRADIEQTKGEMQQAIPGGKETILVVEDEEMLTRLLRTSLQTAGYTVLVAIDGQEAVDLFDRHQNEIQLVLCDVGLPKLTGYDVFREMKRIKSNLKFILASGFIEPHLKSEIFEEGVRDFVQKPYSVYEVLKAIRTTLDHK